MEESKTAEETKTLEQELRDWYMVHVQGEKPGPEYRTTCDVEHFIKDMNVIFDAKVHECDVLDCEERSTD